MKSFLKIILLLCILLFPFKKSFSQIPAYTLTAKNFAHLTPNSFSFDIIMVHIDSTLFEYAAGQYFFNFDTAISNGGILNFAYAQGATSSDSSDLSPSMRPRNPQISGTQLRLGANSLPGPGNGPILLQGIPLKIIKMRLSTSAASFANVPLNLQWRNAPSANPVTKILTYINFLNTEITTPETHSVDTTFIIPPHITCSIKLAIEGLYNTVTGHHNKRDSVTAYLAAINSPFQILDSAKAIIDSVSLSGVFDFLNTNTGPYYIIVTHKNSLETWSKAGGENLITGNNNYDFTSSSAQSYGNNLVLKERVYCIYSGNINRDNFIDLTDMLLVDNDAFNYVGGIAITNLNGDNIVDIDDLAIVDYNARNLVSVQRPGALASSGINRNK